MGIVQKIICKFSSHQFYEIEKTENNLKQRQCERCDKIEVYDKCRDCKGTGTVESVNIVSCGCGGSGMDPDAPPHRAVKCSACGGSGVIEDGTTSEKCYDCNGKRMKWYTVT